MSKPHFARILSVKPLNGGFWVQTAMSQNTRQWWRWHLFVSGIDEEFLRFWNNLPLAS